MFFVTYVLLYIKYWLSSMFFYQKIWPDVPPDFHNPSSFQLPINQEAVKPKEFVRSRCIISEVKWCEYGLWSQLLVFDKCVPNFYDAATDFLQKAAANTEQSRGPGSNICKCDTYGCFEGDLGKTSSRVCGDKKTDMLTISSCVPGDETGCC